MFFVVVSIFGSEGCCVTSSGADSGKALFLCWFCVMHGYFNINPTDDKKKKEVCMICKDPKNWEQIKWRERGWICNRDKKFVFRVFPLRQQSCTFTFVQTVHRVKVMNYVLRWILNWTESKQLFHQKIISISFFTIPPRRNTSRSSQVIKSSGILCFSLNIIYRIKLF